MNKPRTLSASETGMDTITVKLPKIDLELLRALAKKMGWSITSSTHKSGYECAMDDIREGRVSEHASVEEYFQRILG